MWWVLCVVCWECLKFCFVCLVVVWISFSFSLRISFCYCSWNHTHTTLPTTKLLCKWYDHYSLVHIRTYIHTYVLTVVVIYMLYHYLVYMIVHCSMSHTITSPLLPVLILYFLVKSTLLYILMINNDMLVISYKKALHNLLNKSATVRNILI